MAGRGEALDELVEAGQVPLLLTVSDIHTDWRRRPGVTADSDRGASW